MCESTLPFTMTKTYGSISINLREKLEFSLYFFSLSRVFSPFSRSLSVFFFCQNDPFSPLFNFSSFIFLFFSFFSFFLDLFSLFLPLIFFFSFGSYPTELPCCSTPIPFKFSFFFFFFIIPFDFLSFISPFDTWLNMSHLSKCYVSLATSHGHHAKCPSPKVPSGIHMVMPCVTRHSVSRKT